MKNMMLTEKGIEKQNWTEIMNFIVFPPTKDTIFSLTVTETLKPGDFDITSLVFNRCVIRIHLHFIFLEVPVLYQSQG